MYGGKFAFQNRLGQLIDGRKFTVFALFCFAFQGNFQVQALGGLIFGGVISRKVFCVSSLGGYIWRGVVLEFYGIPVKILFHYLPILLFLINAFQMKERGNGKRAKEVKGESERAPSVTFETQNSKLNNNTCMVLCRKNEGQCVTYK